MNARAFFRLTWALGVAAGGLAAGSAQDLRNLPLPAPAGTARVDGALIKLVREIPPAQRAAPTAPQRAGAVARARALRLKLRDDDKVFVEIIGPDNGNIERDLDLPALRALGLQIGEPVKAARTAPNARVQVPLMRTATRAEAWLPLAAVERMDVLLPAGWRVRAVTPPPLDQAVAGEGPARINSNTYRTGGANGAGLTIAIIDSNFAGLTAAQANGDAPAIAARIDYQTDGNFESGASTHGTDCVQNVFDHAPGATYRLYRMSNPTNYEAIITDCLANNVNIISHSISQYNEGWGDDTGVTCQQATRAANAGILFFTSCGNRANSHYEGAFTDTDGDGFHEFAPGDEGLDITVAMNGGGSHYLSWSNPASDFDFYITDAAATSIVASSATDGAGVFEDINFNPGATAGFRLVVQRRSGSAASTIEIFSHNSATWNEYAVAAGSNTAPSNATHPNVVSVGAVTQGSFGAAAGANVIANYSSRGPSNGGMTLPDLCGPTDTLVFPPSTPPAPANTFSGTSCATPNVAGAAAAFWSADLTLSADGIRWLLTTQAGLFRDWGAPGAENIYGAGGARLVGFRAGTRWVARDYPGTLDDGTVPFHTAQAAYVFAPAGGRLLLFGENFGTFPGPAQMGPFNKALTLEVVPTTGAARIGQ